MSQPQETPLNQGQSLAADGILHFLLGKEKELIISGGGGVGKTYLMRHVINKLVQEVQQILDATGGPKLFDSIEVCATTNKAADVLCTSTNYPTTTIHNLLGLTVATNFKTGETSLARKKGALPVENKLIIIDECSMIDRNLYHEINALTINCKIIYVGDHCQLAPVKETLSPIYNQRLPFYNLTEPMRNAEQPALMALCQQFRDTVEMISQNGGNDPMAFKPIQEVPGVIDHVGPAEMQNLIDSTFATQNDDARILAYTNRRVNEYNQYVRVMRNLPPEFTVGEHLVINNALMLPNITLPVESEVELLSLGAPKDTHIAEFQGEDVYMSIQRAEILHKTYGEISLNIPANFTHYRDLKDWFRKEKSWRNYYNLHQGYPDLRPRDASTVHKAQGSTYGITFVDLTDISTCTSDDQVARMLYVALSRSRNRVVLFGELKPRHGGAVIKA